MGVGDGDAPGDPFAPGAADPPGGADCLGPGDRIGSPDPTTAGGRSRTHGVTTGATASDAPDSDWLAA